LAAGTAINALGAVVGQALELLTVAVTVERIGAPAFGVIVLAQGWSMLPYLLESGVGQQVVRAVAGEGRIGDKEATLDTAVAFYLALGVLTVVLGLLASWLLLDHVFELSRGSRADAVRAFNLVMVAGGIRLGLGFIPRVLVGATRLPALRLAGMVRSAGALVLTLALVESGRGGVVHAALALLFAEVAAGLVGLVIVVPRHVRPRLTGITREAARLHVRASGPLLASSGIALFSSRLDPVVVAVALGPGATAVYGIVLKAYDAFRSATELLSLVLMPAAARALSRDEAPQLATLFRRALLYIAVIVWPLTIATAIFAGPILDIWVGDRVSGAVRPLVTAMLLVMVLGPSVAALYVITGAQRVRAVLGAQAAGAAINFVVGVTLVRSFGVAAVFLGSIVGTLVSTRSYLRVVGDLAGVTIAKLLAAVNGVAVAVAVVAVLLGLVRVTTTGAASAALAGAALAVYGAVALAYLVPRLDLRRLMPGQR
jgi:O-antigen/teichoic acid export membrane protein